MANDRKLLGGFTPKVSKAQLLAARAEISEAQGHLDEMLRELCDDPEAIRVIAEKMLASGFFSATDEEITGALEKMDQDD